MKIKLLFLILITFINLNSDEPNKVINELEIKRFDFITAVTVLGVYAAHQIIKAVIKLCQSEVKDEINQVVEIEVPKIKHELDSALVNHPVIKEEIDELLDEKKIEAALDKEAKHGIDKIIKRFSCQVIDEIKLNIKYNHEFDDLIDLELKNQVISILVKKNTNLTIADDYKNEIKQKLESYKKELEENKISENQIIINALILKENGFDIKKLNLNEYVKQLLSNLDE